MAPMHETAIQALNDLRATIVEQRERSRQWGGQRGSEVATYDKVLGWIDELLPVVLKPCPFCGGSNIVKGPYVYRCADCGGQRRQSRSDAEAAAAWNERKEA